MEAVKEPTSSRSYHTNIILASADLERKFKTSAAIMKCTGENRAYCEMVLKINPRVTGTISK